MNLFEVLQQYSCVLSFVGFSYESACRKNLP